MFHRRKPDDPANPAAQAAQPAPQQGDLMRLSMSFSPDPVDTTINITLQQVGNSNDKCEGNLAPLWMGLEQAGYDLEAQLPLATQVAGLRQPLPNSNPIPQLPPVQQPLGQGQQAPLGQEQFVPPAPLGTSPSSVNNRPVRDRERLKQ